MEMKKVLFPTDFSETANRSLPHALKIAHKYNAQVTLLHVRTPYADDPNRPEYQLLDEGKYEEYIRRNIDQLSREIESSHRITTAVARDFNPASGILEFIRENAIDLTAMGTHGRSALAHFFLGSVAEEVVRSASCPVLTVAQDRENYRSNPDYKKILIAFDFSEYSREAARKAREIAGAYGARLQALYVIEQEVPPAYYGMWRNTLARQLPEIAAKARESLIDALGEEIPDDLGVHVKIGEGKAYREIGEFARENEIDLIVMGTHGRSGIERMLLGSTTERVIRIASCPVLTFKLDTDSPPA